MLHRLDAHVHVSCAAVKQQKTCQQPHFVDWAIWEHGCVMEKNVCFDQVSKQQNMLWHHRKCWPAFAPYNGISADVRAINISICMQQEFCFAASTDSQCLVMGCLLNRDISHKLMPLLVLLVTHYSGCDRLQSVFIVFQDKIRPGKNYTGSQLFDNGGAFYNVPGYLDNLKVGFIRQLDCSDLCCFHHLLPCSLHKSRAEFKDSNSSLGVNSHCQSRHQRVD